MTDRRYQILPAADGDICGCRVIDPDGHDLVGVVTAEWRHLVGELPQIRITVHGKPGPQPLTAADATVVEGGDDGP